MKKSLFGSLDCDSDLKICSVVKAFSGPPPACLPVTKEGVGHCFHLLESCSAPLSNRVRGRERCSWWSRLSTTWVSQVTLVVKYPPAYAGGWREVGSIPGLGRSPGGGHGNPLQYSCLENPTEEPGGLQSIGSQRDTTEVTHQARKHHLDSWSSLSDKCRAADTRPLIFSGLLSTLYFSVSAC